MRSVLKFNLLAAVIFLSLGQLVGQEMSTKECNRSWDGVNELKVSHRYGTLEVVPYDGSEVKLVAKIVVKANDEEDAKTVVDHFEIDERRSGDLLEISTQLDTRSWNTTANNTRIKFADGAKATGIKSIAVEYKLQVPRLEVLALSNKYDDIVIGDTYPGNIEIYLYDGSLVASDIEGALDLEFKYSDGRVGDAGDVTLDLYDSEFELGSAEILEMESKYSEYALGDMQSAEIDSYDDEITIGNVANALRIRDKYSEYEITRAGTVDIEMYDGDVVLDSTTAFSGQSKYSGFRIKDAGKVDLSESYDDDYEIGRARSFRCNESKYSTFDMEEVSEKVVLVASFDDNLFVGGVRPSFQLLDIDCKYGDVKVPLGDLAGYKLKANTRYGRLKYDGIMEKIIHIEKNDVLELEGVIGSADGITEVNIRAYDSAIRLSN